MANKRPNSLSEELGRVLNTKESRKFTQQYSNITNRMNELSSEYAELDERISTQYGDPNQLSSDLEPQYYKDLTKQGAIEKQLDRLGRRQTLMSQTAGHRGMQQAENLVRRNFDPSTVNGAAIAISRGVMAQREGIAMGANLSWDELQSRKSAIQNQLSSAEQGMAETLSMDPKDPSTGLRRRALEASRNTAVKNLANLTVAERTAQAMGKDPASIYGNITEAYTKAKPLEGTGGAADHLIRAFEALNKIVDKTSQAYAEQEKVVNEAAKSFSGGGGGGGFSKAASIANFGATALTSFGNATQQMLVNQRLGQMYNAAGDANWEVQKYQTYKSAAGGDIASLIRLSGFAGAERFGGEVRNAAGGAQIANAGGGFLSAAGGFLGGAAHGSWNEAMSGWTSGLAGSAISTSDALLGISANQAKLAGQSAVMEVNNAANAVGAEQLQGFRDFGVGMGSAAIGMGSRGNSFLRRTISQSSLDTMAYHRISPEQMTQMSQAGVANMGSTFDENQVFAARSLEARGLGSMQENMQRMSALSNAGTNNPKESLAGVLEVALTKGLDSSKALNAVVDHTATMAAASSGRALGLDTSAAAATLLTSGISKDTPNYEAAITRAASLQGKIKDITTNTGVDFAGLVATTRTARMAGVDQISGQILQGMDSETLKSMLNNPGARGMLLDKGVDVRGVKDINKSIQGALTSKQLSLEEGGGVGFALSGGLRVDRNEIVRKINANIPLTPDEQLYQGRVGSLSLQGTGSEVNNAVGGINTPIDKSGKVGKMAMTMPAGDEANLRTQLDKMRTMGFEQLTMAAGTAASSLGGASVAVGKLSAAFEHLASAMPNIEKSAAGAAGRAATGQVDVAGFNDAIKNLDKVLQRALGRPSNSSKTQTPTN